MIKKNYVKYIIIGLVGIFLFFLMKEVPLLGEDDYFLYRKFSSLQGTIDKGLFKLLMSWNVRSGQIIGFLLGRLPRYAFYIVNSIMILIYIYLIHYYSFIDQKKEKFYFTICITFFYLFYLFPATFDDFFWMAGSCNHLYSVIFNLAFFLPFYRLLNNLEKPPKYYPLYLVLAVLAGSSMENIPIFIITVVTFILIFRKNKIKYLIKNYVIPFLLYITSYLILIFNHSTERRLHDYQKYYQKDQLVGLDKIVDILKTFIKQNKYTIILFVILLMIYIIHKKFILPKRVKINLILLLVSLETLLIFYFIPYYSNRAMLFLSSFFLINITFFLSFLCTLKKAIFKVLISLLFLLDIYGYTYFYQVYKNSKIAINERNIYLLKQKDKDIYHYSFPPCDYGQRVIEYKYNNDNPHSVIKYHGLDEKKQVIYEKNSQYRKYCIKYNPIFNIEKSN